MGRKRGGRADVNMTSFMDIITGTVGAILMIMLSMILSATENPSKDIIIKTKQIGEGVKEKQVRYVETGSDGITIYPDRLKVRILGMEAPNSEYMEFLRKIDRDKEYIIFAIRPDGYRSFQKARDIAEKNQVEVGYEPIDKLWTLTVEEDA